MRVAIDLGVARRDREGHAIIELAAVRPADTDDVGDPNLRRKTSIAPLIRLAIAPCKRNPILLRKDDVEVGGDSGHRRNAAKRRRLRAPAGTDAQISIQAPIAQPGTARKGCALGVIAGTDVSDDIRDACAGNEGQPRGKLLTNTDLRAENLAVAGAAAKIIHTPPCRPAVSEKRSVSLRS